MHGGCESADLRGKRVAMANGSMKWVTLAGISLIAISFTSACGQLIPVLTPSRVDPSVGSSAQPVTTPVVSVAAVSAANVTTTPAATTRQTGPRQLAVKRGSIIDVLSVDGVITPQDQTPITYSGRG